METHKITNNFTWDELTHSATAEARGIDNTPSMEVKANLLQLCVRILQPIRDEWGKEIIVSSGYRCPKLNTYVGGAKNSQHMKGQAADIHTKSDSSSENKKLFDMIVDMSKKGKIVTGQIIDEYGYNWIHVSLPAGHTNQILHIK